MDKDNSKVFENDLQSLHEMINRVNGNSQIKNDSDVSIVLTDSYRPKPTFLRSILRLFM